MKRTWLRFARAAFIAVIAVWAGAHLYSTRMAARAPSGSLKIAASEARAPAGDFTAGPDTIMPPAVKIPQRLPDFSLEGRDGKPTSIKAWGDKSLIINFWATWCAPCRREIPLLESLHSEWAGRGMAVVGIAVDDRDRVLAYAAQFKIPYPLLIGEQDALDAAAAFGVESPAFPFTVFTDRRGEVVALYVGELHKPEVNLILSVVQNLNQDHVALPQARRTIADGLHALSAARTG
ncbi:MAG: TlpA family protein disulfide reductase [Steroidobacteraceae bacterium]